MNHIISPIGSVTSCFKEKFGIPRQSLLTPSSFATINLISPYNREEAWKGIEEFDYLWLFFHFHKSHQDKELLSVRPPRLGGEKKQGVFATRSPYRPNEIGQSIVKLDRIINERGKISLEISGHDLLDQTPVIDIKPYIPMYDSVPHAHNGWIAQTEFTKLEVCFSSAARQELEDVPRLKNLIQEVISCDPRPAQQRKQEQSKEYRMHLADRDIIWSVEQKKATIHHVITL